MTRHGVALIMALAACVVLLAGASVIARTRATTAMTERTDESLTIAWSVCDAADAAIIAWLREESRDIVLDPDASAPMIPVLDDTFRADGQGIRITITAWDQCGMLPRMSWDDLPATRRLAKRHGAGEARWVKSRGPGVDLASRRQPVFPSPHRPDALGGIVATHNPPPGVERRRGGTVPSININTAPGSLLRTMFADMGIGGIDRVLASRTAGERAMMTHAHSTPNRTVRFVSASGVWSFRTDVVVGNTHASVWSVYRLHGGSWFREQRLVVTD